MLNENDFAYFFTPKIQDVCQNPRWPPNFEKILQEREVLHAQHLIFVLQVSNNTFRNP